MCRPARGSETLVSPLKGGLHLIYQDFILGLTMKIPIDPSILRLSNLLTDVVDRDLGQSDIVIRIPSNESCVFPKLEALRMYLTFVDNTV